MNICSSCFALEGWNTAGPLGPSWWPHPVSQETNYSMSLRFRQHFLDSMWDKNYLFGEKCQNANWGSPISHESFTGGLWGGFGAPYRS